MRGESVPGHAGREPNGVGGEWLAFAVRMLFVAAAYYVAGRLSLRYSLVEENITPVWPPSGIALVAFLVFGRRIWPGVAVAAFLVNLPITDTVWAAVATAGGNTLAPVVAASLLVWVGFRREIDRLRDAAAIVVLGALLSMALSATVGAWTLVLSGVIPSGDFLGAWSVWWAGDAMGVLVVAPFLFALPLIARDFPRSWAERGEALAVFVLLAVVSSLALSSELPLLFAILPFLGWAAWRFQQRGAAPAALLVSGLATWAAATEMGPFQIDSLLDRMLTLQAFNAAVAFTSFVFAALVTERLRSRQQLEAAAADLEERVHTRTLALSEANALLGQEISDRVEAEARLRASERQLADAQEVARIGSWEWDLASEQVSWSDELYRIHGYGPQEFPMTFERATALVLDEDRQRIRDNVELALQRHSREVPHIEYRIARSDGSVRVLVGTGRLDLTAEGSPVRMVGTVQDITERREYEREHRIAQTLQRALLPRELPDLDGFVFAARYLPAEAGAYAGGDWYDVIPLVSGDVALVIGDVAGHGLEAASVMAQVRMAVRAYALEGIAPTSVVARAHALLRQLHGGRQMVTMLFLVIDGSTLRARVVNAGHPPPLVVDLEGSMSYATTQTSLPIGVDSTPGFSETEIELRAGSTLVLYTDGLIDRRDLSVDEGLERLKAVAWAQRDQTLDELCARLVAALVPDDAPDDIALLCARVEAARADRFHLRIPAVPSELASVRRSVARWLSVLELDANEVDDIVLACSEACANAIEHAYGPAGGPIEIELAVDDGVAEMTVRDFGRWRPTRSPDEGRGLAVIDAAMHDVSFTRGEEGTEIRMRRSIQGRVRV
jgi:PAS domain S-box-containing protein